jgi:hypothetical protein
VLSTEQHRRVVEPVAAALVDSASEGTDTSLQAERALHELDRLLSSARSHLAQGALSGDTLHALVTTVLDAAADQKSADDDVVLSAGAQAIAALDLAAEREAGEAEAIAFANQAQVAEADAEVRAEMAEAETESAVEAARAVAIDADQRIAVAEAEAEAEIAAARDTEVLAERRAEMVEAEADAAVQAARAAELDAEERAEMAEAEADVAFEFAEAMDQEADRRVAEARAEAEEAIRAAQAAELDALARADMAEANADAIASAALDAVSDAHAEADSARFAAQQALEFEARAERATAWAIGRMHLMCGLCAQAVQQVEAAEDGVTLAVSDFLDFALGSGSATPFPAEQMEYIRESMQQVLGDEVTQSLMELDSMPSGTDLRVLAVAFCPDPREHPEVAQYQADLTREVVHSLVSAG